jgi:protein transport protein YIF1
MALVTYTVISALRASLDSNFHAEVLAAKTSTTIAIILLECLFIKLGCYALGRHFFPQTLIVICTDDCSVGVEGLTQFLDIISYMDYKFVASTVLLHLHILHLRASLYWTVFIYLFATNGFFLVRSFLFHLQNPF